MICSGCGGQNEPGRKFCGECGTRLAAPVSARVAGSMCLLRLTLSVISSLALLALAEPAVAAEGEPRPVPGIVGEAQRWLSAASAGPLVASEPTTHGVWREGSPSAEHGTASPASLTKDKPFLDFSAPTLSLVARDWHGSLRIAGDRKLLVDDLRPTASSRLIVARIATDARLTTFAQVGAGEWRIDPVMFPNARAYSEVAGQISVGFELRLPSGLRVAGEGQYTALFHDLHYSTDEIAPRIMAFVVAFDGRF